jgi:hypothetical protein
VTTPTAGKAFDDTTLKEIFDHIKTERNPVKKGLCENPRITDFHRRDFMN